MNVGIYCRVSTEEQNTKSQELALIDYANRQPGWTIHKVYTDVYTGSASSRPAFNDMLEDVRLKKLDCVMVTKLDRIGRSLKHLLSLFDEFRNKGVSFIALTQNIDTTTASGRLQLHIIGAFAEFERNIISERTKEALKIATGVGKRGEDKKPRKRRGSPNKKEIWDP